MALDELHADVDEAFAEAMDATTDDAFLARVARALRQRRAPIARRVLRGPLPLAARLLRANRQASRRRPRPGAPGILSRLRRPRRADDLLRRLRLRGGGGGVEAPTPEEGPSEDERRQEEYRQATFEQWQDTTNEWLQRMQEASANAVDSFAAVAARRAAAGADLDAMIPVLAGLAARRSIRALIPPRMSRTRPDVARGLARTLVPAVSHAARRLSRRFGPEALPIVTRLLRAATATVARRGLQPAAVAQRLRGLTARALSRPEQARALVRRAAPGGGLGANALDALEGDYATPEASWERTNPAGRADRSPDGSSLVISNFSVDIAALKPEHVSAIREFARDFARSRSLRDPLARVSIIGHASTSGPDRHNLALSRARARAAASVFLDELRRQLRGRVRRGAENIFLERFRQNRLTVGGRGIAESRTGGASPQAMARNRRVVLSIETMV